MAHSIPFLSISRDAQLLIYNKMDNRDLAAVASSCRDAYEFTEKNKKSLSSRPDFGTSFGLWAKHDGTIVCANSLLEYEEGQFEIPVDEDFIDKMSLISVASLTIRVQNNSCTPRIVEILKNWNPFSYYISFDGDSDIPFLTRVEILEICKTRYSNMLQCDPIVFIEMKDRLAQSPKAGKFHINMRRHDWNEDNMFDDVRPFYGFSSDTRPEFITKFLMDLAKSKEIGRFRHSSFEYDFVPLEGLVENTLHVPYKLWAEDAKLLFIQYTAVGYRKYPSWTIQKIPLKNNLCAFVNEKEPDYHPGRKEVRIEIIHDNEEEILKYLIKETKICSEYFSNDHKMRYLEMNDSERLNDLVMRHVFHEHFMRSEFHQHCINF